MAGPQAPKATPVSLPFLPPDAREVFSGLSAFPPVVSFLPSRYLRESHLWPVCLSSLQRGSMGSHTHFSGTIPTSCKTQDPWGPRDLEHPSSQNRLPFSAEEMGLSLLCNW